jgi:hypothetical protein
MCINFIFSYKLNLFEVLYIFSITNFHLTFFYFFFSGLSIHTFHGNFFVRSTDLLSLPNVNPDAGFGMQVSIDENLNNVQSVCFQAALLYTSSKGKFYFLIIQCMV